MLFRIKIIGTVLILAILTPMQGQDSLQTIVAEKGDGIYSILRKFGLSPAQHYHNFIALNEADLKEDLTLLEGKAYVLPQVENLNLVDSFSTTTVHNELSTGVSHAIFGEKHALVTAVSERLKNNVYYLISGHGGPDPGAIATYAGTTIAEDEYAYDVTLRLAKELMSHGATVYIIIQDPDDGIRDDRILALDRDEVAYPNLDIPLGQLARLEQRVAIVNRLYQENMGKYQRLIVTHVDSRSEGKNIDVFFYHHEKSTHGKKLVESIHKTFQDKYKQHQPNRLYDGTFADRSGLYLIKNTKPAIAYIEIGNIRNTKDQKRILDPVNRQALANWISEGILLDFERK
ncbi:N-acetylmuramoyl-L-alanine amidase [Arenibacter sp. GZD96]|uniref:N-acetylmuramoyl-L-alanine amidase family protein n=1 Tax=Aurantibrevibacter litoralis TaxID=3106030 RepID=UPI002AFED995|nr:N-acetylmuramoyl-L-alanine amidase [Arenibacter sp. GZD-96]MEA1785582.1 N-acetylmuramoyl-L-alanine amidase [Arenibacter sp. GZD-96]